MMKKEVNEPIGTDLARIIYRIRFDYQRGHSKIKTFQICCRSLNIECPPGITLIKWFRSFKKQTKLKIPQKYSELLHRIALIYWRYDSKLVVNFESGEFFLKRHWISGK